MIQPKLPLGVGLRSSEKGWNASFLTGNKTKTLCLDQQMHIGTGIWTALGNYDRPNR
jgi:hypothetical protein